MSFVEDARRLMQDFVAPELRSITIRLDSADKLATERHAAMLEKIDGLRREIKLQIDLALANRKLEELERKQQASLAQSGDAPSATV